MNNYGVLTEISKGINKIVGDQSGRTVSRRTAQGLKKTFELHHQSDEQAEEIAHAAMVATGVCLTSKYDDVKIVGGLLTIALVAFYQNGR